MCVLCICVSFECVTEGTATEAISKLFSHPSLASAGGPGMSVHFLSGQLKRMTAGNDELSSALACIVTNDVVIAFVDAAILWSPLLSYIINKS